MTIVGHDANCALCGAAGTTIELPRRTIARGLDPEDAAFSIIAVLPDLELCDLHAEELGHGEFVLGWCDDEQCRCFGRSGEASGCGTPYKALKH
jgi:hypothetical protein